MVLLLAQIDLGHNSIGGYGDEDGDTIYTPEGPGAIANALRVSASLTAADLRWNSLDLDAKQQVRDSVRGRDGFKLEL